MALDVIAHDLTADLNAEREKAQSTATWEHEDLAQVRIKVLRGHVDSIQSCDFFDNDTQLITASFDQTIKLWECESGETLHTLNGHNAYVSEARGHTATKRCVSAGWDKKVHVWDLESGTIVWTGEHEGAVTCCGFSSDGKFVVSGSDLDNSVKIWDAKDGTVIHHVEDLHTSTLTSCQFVPNGDRILTSSMDRTARFWDLRSHQNTLTLKGHINVISDCSCTSDERKVATVSWDKSIQIWDVSTGMYRSHGPRSLDKAHEGSISCCNFSYDGSMLVTGSYDQGIIVWDVENMVEKLKLQGHIDWVEDVQFSKDKKWLMSCSKDRTVRLWNVENTDRIPVVLENQRSIGLKVVNCSTCGKPFSMAQVQSSREVTVCVFCRLQTPDRNMPAIS